MTKRDDLMALANEYNEVNNESNRLYDDLVEYGVKELEMIGGEATTDLDAYGVCTCFELIDVFGEKELQYSVRLKAKNTDVGNCIMDKKRAQNIVAEKGSALLTEIAFLLHIDRKLETYHKSKVVQIILDTIEAMRE